MEQPLWLAWVKGSTSTAALVATASTRPAAETLSWGGAHPFWKDMSDKQQSALISFAWNLGEGFYGDEVNFHTITSCLRNRDWSKVADALLLYCMSGTAVHQGLLQRRQAEANL
jgi:GH24 family phage-related lysozyme (muramidase)